MAITIIGNNILNLQESEYEMKYKKGQRVRAIRYDEDITKGNIYNCYKDSDYNWCYIHDDEGETNYFALDWFEPIPKTTDDVSTLEVGDVLVGDMLVKYNNVRTVLGVCGLVAFLGGVAEPEHYDTGYTSEDLKNNGYKLKDSEPEVLEVTLDEIAEKYGVPVDKLKVKKK